MGCAVRLSADADWDCCSVNKTVRGCSAVFCAKDTDGVNTLFVCLFLNDVPCVVFQHASSIAFCNSSLAAQKMFMRSD